MMKFPDMGKDWDSRFMEDFAQKNIRLFAKVTLPKYKQNFQYSSNVCRSRKTKKHVP